MVHARSCASRAAARRSPIDEAAIRRAAKGRSRSSATAISSRSSAPTRPSVEAAAARRAGHVVWDGVDRDQPVPGRSALAVAAASLDRQVGRAAGRPGPAGARREASFTRMHIAHASVAPSCGIAVYRDGKLEVWTHSQGVYPLRAALART
jgi:hypothetical protein